MGFNHIFGSSPATKTFGCQPNSLSNSVNNKKKHINQNSFDSYLAIQFEIFIEVTIKLVRNSMMTGSLKSSIV